MSDPNTTPFPTKFKPSDWVRYDGYTWKIDFYCKLQYDVHGYDISRENGSRTVSMCIPIKEGDSRFTKA